jgi:D-inositol-3-phosphate glycosyltransferase
MHTNPIAQPGTGDAGGMNVYVHQLALGLAAKGTEVEIFTRSPEMDDDIGQPTTNAEPLQIAPRVRLWQIKTGASDLQKSELAGVIPDFVNKTQAVIAEQFVDPVHLIHSHYWLSGIAGLELAEQLGVPLIHTMHTNASVKNARLAPGDTPEPHSRLAGEHRIVDQANALMALTNQEKQDLVTNYAANAEKIQVINPGVDKVIFHPDGDQIAARTNLGISANDQIVLFAGRIQKLKAPDVLIKALPHLPESVRLVIVGGPSGNKKIIPALKNLAAELGVAGRVQFLGPIPPTELAQWYRAADVVAVPSYNETFGLVAAEAIACGTPVVGADVGGLREIIDDGVTGLLVRDYEGKTWADALASILALPTRRAEMSRAAAAQSGRFTWAQTAAQTLEGYHRVLEQHLSSGNDKVTP